MFIKCFIYYRLPTLGLLQGYAYILTHPGIPTVFYDHFYDWGNSTREQIVKLVRNSTSTLMHFRLDRDPLITNLNLTAD